eukprot:175831_1
MIGYGELQFKIMWEKRNAFKYCWDEMARLYKIVLKQERVGIRETKEEMRKRKRQEEILELKEQNEEDEQYVEELEFKIRQRQNGLLHTLLFEMNFEDIENVFRLFGEMTCVAMKYCFTTHAKWQTVAIRIS